MEFDFDVITIGAGVIGAAISDELSKRNLKVVILEKKFKNCPRNIRRKFWSHSWWIWSNTRKTKC